MSLGTVSLYFFLHISYLQTRKCRTIIHSHISYRFVSPNQKKKFNHFHIETGEQKNKMFTIINTVINYKGSSKNLNNPIISINELPLKVNLFVSTIFVRQQQHNSDENNWNSMAIPSHRPCQRLYSATKKEKNKQIFISK